MRPEDNKTKDRPVRACAAAKSPDDAAAILFYDFFPRVFPDPAGRGYGGKMHTQKTAVFGCFPGKNNTIVFSCGIRAAILTKTTIFTKYRK